MKKPANTHKHTNVSGTNFREEQGHSTITRDEFKAEGQTHRGVTPPAAYSFSRAYPVPEEEPGKSHQSRPTASDSSLPTIPRKRKQSQSDISVSYGASRRSRRIASMDRASRSAGLISTRWSRSIVGICTRTTCFAPNEKAGQLCLAFDKEIEEFEVLWKDRALLANHKPLWIDPLDFRRVLRSGCGAKVRLEGFADLEESEIIDIHFKDFQHAEEFMENWNTVCDMKFTVVEK